MRLPSPHGPCWCMLPARPSPHPDDCLDLVVHRQECLRPLLELKVHLRGLAAPGRESHREANVMDRSQGNCRQCRPPFGVRCRHVAMGVALAPQRCCSFRGLGKHALPASHGSAGWLAALGVIGVLGNE